ncbi:hypothetical protein N7481_005644 [Penicillium waksmanii]|uniref:uncharacterized protein n=1 Tax=Penicillium waksmanii TaxID=69791 RepID=UPI0025474FCC|nr:uncharacterized protein N7481_005644 [Penicillium waksmanii]KAJ5983545.1 hypothetical protein N7481_005644 [Penicillium waksmanii]
MQPSPTVSGGDTTTTTTTTAAVSATNTNTTSWTQNLMTSIRDFFTQEPASEPESDALAGWVVDFEVDSLYFREFGRSRELWTFKFKLFIVDTISENGRPAGRHIANYDTRI